PTGKTAHREGPREAAAEPEGLDLAVLIKRVHSIFVLVCPTISGVRFGPDPPLDAVRNTDAHPHLAAVCPHALVGPLHGLAVHRAGRDPGPALRVDRQGRVVAEVVDLDEVCVLPFDLEPLGHRWDGRADLRGEQPVPARTAAW